MKPWSGLAAMMLLLTMALWVASLASSSWVVQETPGIQRYHGPFEACANDWQNNIHECRRVDNDCSISWSSPLGMDSVGSSCLRVRVVRAFSILALIFAAMAFVPAWLGYNSFDDLMYRLPVMALSLLSMLFGLVAWAVWISVAQQEYTDDWRHGWPAGLALGAWLLPLCAAIAAMIPSPLRDMSTGKVIARESMHGGGYADMLHWSWWTRGKDWGGREAGSRGADVSAPGAYGSSRGGYETAERGLPPGTAYRESRPASSPRTSPRATGTTYTESAPFRGSEHGAAAERGYGTETETERLARERGRTSSLTGSNEPSMMEKFASKIPGTEAHAATTSGTHTGHGYGTHAGTTSTGHTAV